MRAHTALRLLPRASLRGFDRPEPTERDTILISGPNGDSEFEVRNKNGWVYAVGLSTRAEAETYAAWIIATAD